MLSRISFSNSDIRYPVLESTASDIATFLFENKGKISDFCDLMRISGTWKKNNYKNDLQKWQSRLVGRRKKDIAPDTQELIQLTNTFFSVCSNDKELKKMRGLVPEKLIELIFLVRYKEKNYRIGFGVVVNVDGKDVKYQCPAPYENGAIDSDKNRQSVDAGVWDGTLGEFVEVKFKPEAFHTKDIKYLRVLANCLNRKKINNNIFLISLDNKDLTQEQLKSIHQWNPQEFILIGRDEIFDLLQSSNYAA